MSEGKEFREWLINPKTGYIRDADYEGRTWGEGNYNAVRIHVIEHAALAEKDKVIAGLVEALEKTIKENTIMLDEFTCKKDGHDWEPDTSMTIMRCDLCGIGANTYEARKVLAKHKGSRGE
jgi:hypothetical protein